MEWVILNPSSIHEVYGLLGYTDPTGSYHVKRETCGDALDELLTKLISDGPCLRTRRSLGQSEVLSKDLIPFLTAASNEHPKAIPKVIKVLSFITSPIECLVPNTFVTTEEGQQVVFEVESLLRTIKVEFSKFKVTQAVVEYLKRVTSKGDPLTSEECVGVSDGLLLLRNILHIPHQEPGTQHQILWNLFAHSIDKILLHLMTCEQKNLWGIALVQLIALIYKDQHVANLQKLLNLWLETSMSESSEDNESNTSPPDHSSSPTLTSDPTSDSSDNGGTSKNVKDQNQNLSAELKEEENKEGSKLNVMKLASQAVVSANPNPSVLTNSNKVQNDQSTTQRNSGTNLSKEKDSGSQQNSQKVYTKAKSKNKGKGSMQKEKMSDVDSGVSSSHFSTDKNNSLGDENEEASHGRGNNGTTVTTPSSENKAHNSNGCYKHQQESNSTSSNDDELLQQKSKSSSSNGTNKRPSKLPAHQVNLTQLRNTSILSAQDKREMKRKKLHKRSKRLKTSMKALVHHNPTEDDISHVLREFTVDFLLKGYGSLVAVLQEQLSINASLQMDKSHFLWLITYFLKFASQMELDLDHISPVLSNKILSYLTYEGVAMCENLAMCKDDIKPHLRRMHLVVTALREFVQAVEIYSNLPSCSREDKQHIQMLQSQMLGEVELRYLFLILIRYFKPGVQSKQYLQDLVITNHVFLLLLEKISSNVDYKGDFKMLEFVKEFSSPLIMQQYGHLLEDFKDNGEFVNDCVFTMMHHIAGDIHCPESLYQPSILKTFSSIWEVEFEIRDDWADLIEYVIQSFMKATNDEKRQIFKSGTSNISDDVGWSKEDFNNLYWYYTKCSTSTDPIAKILDLYGDASGKTRESILNQLLHQRIIGYNQFLRFLASERVETSDGAATGGCSSTSSSHATAGSSCYSIPPSRDEVNPSPIDEICELDSIEYCNTDPYPFTKDGSIPPVELFAVPEEDGPADKLNNDNNGEIEMMRRSCSFRELSRSDTRRSPETTMPMDISNMDITVSELINQISTEGHDLSWLQTQILEACYVKFRIEKKEQRAKRAKITGHEIYIRGINREKDDVDIGNAGPIPFHCSLLGQSIPIIPWTHWQEILLMSPPYLVLLHKLGFHLPGEVGKLFPRIPRFWTSDILLSVAEKLGPLPPTDKMKFDPLEVIQLMETTANELDESSSNMLNSKMTVVTTEEIPRSSNDSSREPTFKMQTMGIGNGFNPSHTSYGFGSATHSVNWMTLVHKSKQLIDRHSEPVSFSSSSSSSSDDEEHMDESTSPKAPALDNSEECAMMSQESGQNDDGFNENNAGSLVAL